MSVYDYTATSLSGEPVPLARFRGQVLLIVNTASECGFTPQYAGLEVLYRHLRDQGFSVLGFPCNQFGEQEPGSAADISAFCEKNYGIDFPMFAKVDVNGPQAHPLFVHLKKNASGLLWTRSIKWNFTKFLVDRQGRVVRRFAPRVAPLDIEPAVKRLLQS
jgi:glutathione peroxidase